MTTMEEMEQAKKEKVRREKALERENKKQARKKADQKNLEDDLGSFTEQVERVNSNMR